MNDRYLYRAKRTDNGEWVEGNLVWSDDADDDYKAIIIPTTGSDMFTRGEASGNLGFEKWYRVDTSTLCQCTGLRDKNGKLIWENDIVRRKIFDHEVIGIVKWLDIGFTGFRLEVAKEDGKKNLYSIGRGTYDDDMGERCDDEIIGNIFDNPELLEAE